MSSFTPVELQLKLTKDHEAIQDCNTAIELDPKEGRTYYLRGLSKAELKDYTGAVEDYSKAIGLAPKYASAYNKRGLAKSMLGDKQGASKDLSKAKKLGYSEASK